MTQSRKSILSLRAKLGRLEHPLQSKAILVIPLCLCEERQRRSNLGEWEVRGNKTLATTPPRLPRHSVPRNDKEKKPLP